ncbi:LuxR family transcriptional regulator [uncultured Arthrobacter sp.]|uniref:helix-turn-helix transcriptional regulator n=1 Tax=uncultured Arthrobacter sp. TaxID=114050 RepID=UPI002607D61A|nr:LuxR family transcriptional regulator [uncultured Arthrobacter sp.]
MTHAPLPAFPYPSRRDLLSKLTTELQQRPTCGAFVYGGPGMGKTAMARGLMAVPTDSLVPLLLTATAILKTVPYGALAPLLVDATPYDVLSPRSVLRLVLSFVRCRSADRRTLVIVDDIHLLDEDSGLLLTQLVGYGAITIVGFAPCAAALSGELAILAKDEIVEQHVMEPLTDPDVLSLCRRTLGPSIARGVGGRLRRESAGNPLFLPGILDQAVRDGSLVVIDGVWVLADTEVRMPAVLGEVVESILVQLGAPERTALDILALSEVLGLADLVRLTSQKTVSSLLRIGLLQSVTGPRAAILETRVLPSRILRTIIPTGRRCSLLRRVNSAIPEDRTQPARHQIRRGLWALECAETVPDDRLLELAALALRNDDPRAALRLVNDIRAPACATEAAVYRAHALFGLSRLDDSRKWSAGLLDHATAPELVTALAVLEHRQSVAAGRDDPAWSGVLGRACRALEDLTDVPSKDHLEANPDLLIERALEWNLLGRYGDTIATLDRILDDGTGDPRRLATAHALVAEALGAVGRAVQGLHHSSAALALVDQHPEVLADLHRGLLLRHVSLLVHGGELTMAEDALDHYTSGTEVDYTFCSGSIAVLDAAIDTRRGQFRRALEKIRPALVSLRRSDHDALLPYALGIASWAAATLGEADQIERWAAEFSSHMPCGAAQYTLLGEALIDASRVLLSTDVTTSRLVTHARTAREHGWYTAEKDILEIATVLDDELSPSLLAVVAAGLEGDESDVLQAYAEGLVSGDAKALASAADGAERQHKHLLAAKATCRAIEFYAGARDEGRRRELGPAARRRRTRIDGVLVVEPSDPHSVPSLTSREREIALLAADGLSNRAIARRLVLSTRTVEGHLYRIFAKLGIAHREDLTGILDYLPRGV